MTSVLTPSPQSIEATPSCPRCGSAEKWGMSSWCPKCGYYPAVDGKRDNGTSWADELKVEAPAEESEDDQSLLSAVPPWMWVMVVGICFIVAVSFMAKSMYDDAEESPGAWAWTQLLAGVAAVAIAHGLSARYAMSRDRRINFGDVLLAWPSIWHPTISILPDGNLRICSLAWGMTAALTSMVVIGGHDVSQFFRDEEQLAEKEDPKKKSAFAKVVGTAAAAAKAAGKKEASLEDALKAIGDGEVIAMVDKLAKKLPSDKESMCRVFAYSKGKDGLPSAVFLCRSVSGAYEFVGKIPARKITPEALKLVAMKVVGQDCEEPICPCDEPAIWVKPVTECRILYASVDEEGVYENVRLLSVVKTPPKARKKSKPISTYRGQK